MSDNYADDFRFVRGLVGDIEDRVCAGERRAKDIGLRVDRLNEEADEIISVLHDLRKAVVAILSHAIRRRHLPQGLTFDSELWDRLRDIGGSEACAEVTEEIERTRSMLRRTCGNNGGAE